MSGERWLRCGAEVVTPDGVQTVSTTDVDGPLVWTEDEYGNTSMWSASALRPLEPVPYREHERVVAERDRLRRELEVLRDEMRNGPGFRTVTVEMAALEARLATRLDAILNDR